MTIFCYSAMTIMFIIAWMCFYSIKTVKKSKTMFYIPSSSHSFYYRLFTLIEFWPIILYSQQNMGEYYNYVVGSNLGPFGL